MKKGAYETHSDFRVSSVLLDDDGRRSGKNQKKEFEAQVKVMTAEAQRLEKAGKLAEARTKYAESQALIEVKDVSEAIKHLDEEIHKRVKDALGNVRKSYETGKYKQAAASLEDGLKFEAFQPVIAYDLALCYYQLGEREKALEYLLKAKAGTGGPKQKQKLLQVITFFTTKENGASLKDADRERISRVNTLSESIGVDASLEDSLGSDEQFAEEEHSSPQVAEDERARRAAQWKHHRGASSQFVHRAWRHEGFAGQHAFGRV